MSRLSLIAVIVAVLVAWCAAFPAKAEPVQESLNPGAFEWRITHDRYPVPYDDPSWFGAQIFAKAHWDDCLATVYDRWSIEVREFPIPITFPTSGRCEVDHFILTRHDVDNPPTTYPPEIAIFRFDAWLIPEPGTLALVGFALAGLALRRKK